MTREEIIKLAKEAGFHDPAPADGYMGLAFDYRVDTDSGASLELFAALVADAEREACAKVCEDAIGTVSEAAIIGDDRHDASINACTNLAKRIRSRNEIPRVKDKK